MFWGKRKENGIWLAMSGQTKFLTGADRLVYFALGKFRFRIMNPFRP